MIARFYGSENKKTKIQINGPLHLVGA